MDSLPILNKTESVFAQFAATASLNANLDATIFQGMDNAVRADFPAVTISAPTADEVERQTAVWRVQLNMQVQEMIADTDKSSPLASAIFKAFSYDGIENDLNNSVSDWYCYEVLPKKPTNNIIGDAWQQEMSFEIICMLQ